MISMFSELNLSVFFWLIQGVSLRWVWGSEEASGIRSDQRWQLLN